MNFVQILRNVGKNGKKEILILSIRILFFRYDVEIAYAKGLRKSSETFQKLAGRAKG